MKSIRLSPDQFEAHQKRSRGFTSHLPLAATAGIAQANGGGSVTPISKGGESHYPAERLRGNLATGAAHPMKSRGMNKLEAQYAQHLDLQKFAGEIFWWGYERVRLKVGNGAWFKPDFYVLREEGGPIELHETKGHRREAAIVRIKACADEYPFQFYLVIRRDSQWIKTRI